MMFATTSEFAAGWHFNKTFNVYQKVNGNVFVYVSPLMFGYKAQLYLRGHNKMMICRLEIRTSSDSNYTVDDMFQISELWLQRYSSGNETIMKEDLYHIDNPSGVWGGDASHLKLYWV